MQIVRTLETVDVPSSRHTRRRVVVAQRPDGHFTFGEQYYYVHEVEGEVIAEG